MGGIRRKRAYWLASAAERIVIDATADLGSNGVVMAVRDPSKAKPIRLRLFGVSPRTSALIQRLRLGARNYKHWLTIPPMYLWAVARQRGIATRASVIADFGQGREGW